jgi:hypothetical protein
LIGDSQKSELASFFFFDVHILKGTPGLFSNPEVKLERVYGVVTWETSGEMYMTSNFSSSGGFHIFLTFGDEPSMASSLKFPPGVQHCEALELRH